MTTYELIKTNLDVSALRSRAIANNIANINTPDYKRYYVEVEKEQSLSIKNTQEKHITNTSKDKITLQKDDTSSTKFDGNNVEIDSEKVDQAANTIYYNTLIAMANNKLASMKIVASGGR